jgi:hypothetical protein
MAYRVLVAADALLEFNGQAKRARLKLIDIFSQIGAFPEAEIDHRVQLANGRTANVRHFGRWIITYFIDSPVRDVHILEIDRA